MGVIQRLPAGAEALVEEITLDEKKGEWNYEQREEPAEAASVSHGRAEWSQILFLWHPNIVSSSPGITKFPFLNTVDPNVPACASVPQEIPSERCSPLYSPLE